MSALIEAARSAMQALYGYPYDDAHWKLWFEPAADNLREALAAAEAQPVPTTIFTAGHVKRLADKMALAKAACDIPNGGDLWRSITQDRYADARQELFDAIDALASGAAAEAQPVGEPFGYVITNNVPESSPYRHVFYRPSEISTAYKDNALYSTPLYTAPPAQPAAQPLTYEQISALVLETVYENDERIPYRDYWVREIGMPFARAIEAAHGIGSQP